MLCSPENSPCRVGTKQSRSAMDQSLCWRRSCLHESHIRPCLPVTIPVFQLFDAPREDGTHPLTRSFASPKELIDESDVLSPLWGVFPLTAARSLPQELHTLLGLCVRVAKAKSGMLREPCGALWGVVLLGPQLGQHGHPAVADDGVFSLPSRCAGAQKISTSPTYHSVFPRSVPSNRWLCKSPSPSVVLG